MIVHNKKIKKDNYDCLASMTKDGKSSVSIHSINVSFRQKEDQFCGQTGLEDWQSRGIRRDIVQIPSQESDWMYVLELKVKHDLFPDSPFTHCLVYTVHNV